MRHNNNPVLVAELVEVKHGVKIVRKRNFGGKIVAKQNDFYAKIFFNLISSLNRITVKLKVQFSIRHQIVSSVQVQPLVLELQQQIFRLIVS